MRFSKITLVAALCLTSISMLGDKSALADEASSSEAKQYALWMHEDASNALYSASQFETVTVNYHSYTEYRFSALIETMTTEDIESVQEWIWLSEPKIFEACSNMEEGFVHILTGDAIYLTANSNYEAQAWDLAEEGFYDAFSHYQYALSYYEDAIGTFNVAIQYLDNANAIMGLYEFGHSP